MRSPTRGRVGPTAEEIPMFGISDVYLKSQSRTGHTRGKGPGKNTADDVYGEITCGTLLLYIYPTNLLFLHSPHRHSVFRFFRKFSGFVGSGAVHSSAQTVRQWVPSTNNCTCTRRRNRRARAGPAWRAWACVAAMQSVVLGECKQASKLVSRSTQVPKQA